MAARTVSGEILCLDAARRRWGSERFDVEYGDRQRVVRGVMHLEDRGLRRDNGFTIGDDGLPREGWLRDTVCGQLAMHGWYRVDGQTVEVEAWSSEGGRISRRVDWARPIEHLGLHCLVADVLVAQRRGPTQPGVELPAVCATSSMRDYGLGGYGVHVLQPLVTYVGAETARVIAGEFDALHFRVHWSDQVPKYSDFWVHREFFVPLRLLGASGEVSYELAELATG